MKIEEIRNEPYFKINKFIKDSGYTYTVKNVLEEYKKHKNGFYVSCTMGICIRHLEDEIKELLEVIKDYELYNARGISYTIYNGTKNINGLESRQMGNR